MTLLIVLAVLTAIAWLPLGVTASYHDSGANADLIVGPVRIPLYPAQKKKQKEKEKQEKSVPQQAKAASPQKGGSIADFVPLVKTALALLGDLRRKLRVDLLVLKLTLAGGDPSDLGQNYGKACAAMGNLWPILENLFVIKKRDVNIQCDFEAEETVIAARIDITITLGRLLYLAVRYGVRALREYLTLLKKRKGGATL